MRKSSIFGPIAAVVAVLTIPVALIVGPAAPAGAAVEQTVQVDSGDSQTCAVTSTGRGYCWGNNNEGQLGNGSVEPSATPVEITTAGTPLAGVGLAQVSGGRFHTCGVTTNGKAVCWGDDAFRQLGTASSANSSVPVAVDTSTALAGKTVAKVDAGYLHSCALTTDGTVACWGHNSNGRLGDGTTTAASTPVALVTAGTPLEGKTIVDVKVGQSHSCALASDGTLACWGANTSGQLGTGNNTDSLVPVAPLTAGTPLAGQTVVEMALAQSHMCVRTATHALSCWGYGGSGQIGDNAFSSRNAPVAVAVAGTPLAGASLEAVDVGGVQSCARTTADVIACWGGNDTGALGNGTTTGSKVPTALTTAGTPLAGASITDVTLAPSQGCALTAQGVVACWGTNQYGQVGDGTQGMNAKPATKAAGVLDGATVAEIDSGGSFSCARTSTGGIACWGQNTSGQLGVGTTVAAALPAFTATTGTALEGRTPTSLSLGASHACAILDDGSAACWGSNSSGRLGRGPTAGTTSKPGAVLTTGTPLAGKTIGVLSAGGGHSCALSTDHVLACWGTNADGELGTGTTTSSNKPIAVVTAGTPLEGKTIVDVVAGYSFTCALTSDSLVACWGANGFGNLGNGTFTASMTPVAVATAGTPLAGKTIVHLETGDTDTVCALTSDGIASCWGSGGYGELADGSTSNRNTPRQMVTAGTPLAGKQIAQIEIGYISTCARATDSTLACWGNGGLGALGTGTTTDTSVPAAVATAGTPLAGAGIADISKGMYASCALTTTSVVSCWGQTADGEAGNGTVGYVLVPHRTLVLPSAPAGTVPGAPTIGTATAGNAQATVTWTAPASDGGSVITGYVVTPYVGAVAQAATTFNSTATTQTVTGLTNGSTYTFKVAAINAVGTGATSAASNAVTPSVPATVPGAPTIGTATAGDAQATVTWTAPASDGGSAITGYVVTPYVGAVAQAATTFNSTATTQTVTALSNGSTYTFKVAAINAVGTGATSAASNAVVPQTPYHPFASWGALVDRMYLDTTNALPSASARTSWVSQLTAGTKTRGDLADSLRRSSENTSNVDPVARLYRAFLARTPDAGGLKFWIGRRRSGNWTLTKMADSFASSSEFKTKYGSLTNRQFVTLIYTDVMGRTADPGGVEYWTGKLNSGSKTRGGVMVGFSESSEYKRLQAENTDVAVAYILLLGRAPSAGEVTDWVTRQKAETTHAVLLRELLDSAGYATHITG